MQKKVIQNQQYEEYWKITLEYTDFYGKQFNTVLKTIIKFINEKVDINRGITSSQYKLLQDIIESIYPKNNAASTRKSINQFFKLGFINNSAKGYHQLANSFLNESNDEQKKLIYSKIMYDNASFSRSATKDSNDKEIQFLIKTLEKCGKLTKEQLLALIFTDISSIKKGYLNLEELAAKFAEITYIHAEKRKYNQRNFLFNLCKNLTGIFVAGNVVSVNSEISLNKENEKGRDPYLQKLYKIELINEYIREYCTTVGKCVLEKLAYPVLIASHIKPYVRCEVDEQFDKNNGLLLSKNMDLLFNDGYITFDSLGKVMPSSKLDKDLVEYINQFSLDSKIYNNNRKRYMEYHREIVFKN